MYVGMTTTTRAFLLSCLRSPRPRAGVARQTAVSWVPGLSRLPQVLNLSHQALGLVSHPNALLHLLSSPPGFCGPCGSGGSRGTIGTLPNSLSVGTGGRRDHTGQRTMQGIRAAGSGGQRGFCSLYKPGASRPPSSLLFSPPPWGLGGDGAGRWQPGGWREQYRACDKSGCCLDKWGDLLLKEQEKCKRRPAKPQLSNASHLSSSCTLFSKPLHLLRSLSFFIQHRITEAPVSASILSLIFISLLALLWDPSLPMNFRALEPSFLGEASPDKSFKPRRTPQGQLESPRREVCPSLETVDSLVNPCGWLLHAGPLDSVHCTQSSMHQSVRSRVGAGYLFIALWTGQRERRN